MRKCIVAAIALFSISGCATMDSGKLTEFVEVGVGAYNQIRQMKAGYQGTTYDYRDAEPPTYQPTLYRPTSFNY